MKNVKIIAAEEISDDQRVLKEAEYLTNKGFNVEILCWDREGQFREKEIEIINTVRIKRFYPRAIYGSGLKQVIPFAKFIFLCRKYLKNREYDFLHCQNLDGFIVGYFINKNIIFDMREYYVGSARSLLKKFFIKMLVGYAVKKSKYIIYVNDTQKKAINSKFHNKLIFLPNFPDNTLLKFDKKEKSDKLRISYIGSVRQFGTLKNLFDAAMDFENVEVSIHGRGTDYKKLKEIEGNYKNVRVTGAYEPKEAGILYNSSDIIYCVYPNSNENWKTAYPIKLFESILTKTPLIANKGSIMGDFILEKGIGFVVDESNVNDIRELIKYILDNRHLLDDKVKELEKIQFDYTWDKVVKNLDMIF